MLSDLIYGWGNEGWSALDEYLAECVREALGSDGPILECGSGLSTVLVGTIAGARGYRLYALEHSPAWSAKVRATLLRHKLDAVTVLDAPLRDFGEFAWYDVAGLRLPDVFAMVICDGPPSNTKGGRYGLVPIMGPRFRSGCVILLDDAARLREQEIGVLWQQKLNASLEAFGSEKPYLKLVMA